MSTSRSLIAVAQMRATLNKEENYSLVEELVEKAASRGAQVRINNSYILALIYIFLQSYVNDKII